LKNKHVIASKKFVGCLLGRPDYKDIVRNLLELFKSLACDILIELRPFMRGLLAAEYCEDVVRFG